MLHREKSEKWEKENKKDLSQVSHLRHHMASYVKESGDQIMRRD